MEQQVKLLRERIRPLVVSAPFGNYLGGGPDITRTLGTYTLYPRPGRWGQVLRTVRYKFRERAWVNRIGLRNPGIDALKGRDLSRFILSIHGFDLDEWIALLTIISGFEKKPAAVELNVACPNTAAVKDLGTLFAYARGFSETVPVIVKVPPADGFRSVFDAAASAGITAFHATNTLPCPEGGKSGAPLLLHALQGVRTARAELPNAFIIGGGGVQSWEAVMAHWEAGADRVAVASALFNPLNWIRARFWACRISDYVYDV